jgi:heme a synthase
LAHDLGPVAAWLFVCAAMVFLMVVVGGITRLTLSGLSITEWKPVTGIVPPLSAADWVAEFAKYKAIPEYRSVHFDMTLSEFKGIYYWEYGHRLLGRLVAVTFAVPLTWFAIRRRLPRSLLPPLCGILLLGLAQGVLGWYMVKSGLADRVEVSQYRLVAHLALALGLYAALLWLALSLAFPVAQHRGRDRGQAAEVSPIWRRAAEAIVLLVALTIAAGGFTAGLRAGLTYNTFPLMDGRLVPADYGLLQPFWRNWFENVAAVQFDHRLLAIATAMIIVLVWCAARQLQLPGPACAALNAVLGAVTLQVALGVATLLFVVPILLAAAHQAVAVALLTAAIIFRHTLSRPRLMNAAV